MKRLADMRALFPACIVDAQAVYDSWEQDADGMDDEYGGGGICDAVADAISDVFARNGVDAGTLHILDDNHTVVIAAVAEGIFHVDIPFDIYERQNGYYDYTKRPGITLTVNMIVCEKIDSDPSKLDQYLES